MSSPDKSFFSGLHLVITGIAALITASVAVIGLSINQGWIGGTKTGGGAGTGTGTSGSTSVVTTAAPEFAVNPTSLTLQPLQPTTVSVEVSNTGVVPMTVEPPTMTGTNAGRFTAQPQTCDGPVDPGRSCQLQVTFNPAPGTFSAILVVQVAGAVRATEVPITATAIL